MSVLTLAGKEFRAANLAKLKSWLVEKYGAYINIHIFYDTHGAMYEVSINDGKFFSLASGMSEYKAFCLAVEDFKNNFKKEGE